ncbi:unnamed protein product [Alternaria alternata]
MAHLIHARSPTLGGHYQDRKLAHETATNTHRSDQRSASPDTVGGSAPHTNGRSGDQSATEGAADEDDEEDSSTAKDNEQDDDETDADVPALPYSYARGGKGKGKRPAIRVEHADDDESHAEEDENISELMPNKHPVNQLLMSNKKRTFSNLSSTSVLFGDDSTDQESFPRRKMARKLSNASSIPLLTYKEDEEPQVSYENAIESDDEDYSGVMNIPDDDESDIEKMEQEEESYILQEEQSATNLLNEYRDARRLSLESCFSDNIFDVTAPLDDEYMAGLADFGFTPFFEPDALPASPVPMAKRKFSDGSAKRVRFDDDVQVSDSSSSESSELDSSVFPDLFLDQDKIPPSLHQLLDMDYDDDNGDMASPQSDASFWDFEQNESRITQVDDSDEDEESSGESSGYESDMGDTTDEEDFGTDILPRTPKQSVLQRPVSAPGSRAGTPKPFQRSSRPIGRQIPPTRGIFIHDETDQAIAVTNRATKAVAFYRPRTMMIPWIPLTDYQSSTSGTVNNSPRNSIAQLNGSDSESNEVFNNGLSTDIMLSGIFGSAGGNDFTFGNESIGPPEAFYPFVSISSNGNMGLVDEDETGSSSDEYDDDLNIADFMDFGESGGDTDLDDEFDETDRPVTPATSNVGHHGSTPAAPATATPHRKRTTSDVMLEHFDRGVVTAFRSNQNRYRDVASLPSDPAARASVSRPVRSGKSAEALITPVRRRVRSNRVAKSPLKKDMTMTRSSPLSGVTKANSRLQKSVLDSPKKGPPKMGTFS